MPECRINLAHCVAYLAESPKSTRSYEAYNRAEEAAKAETTAVIPMHLRNAPTKLMKDLGYGSEYVYNPLYAYVLTHYGFDNRWPYWKQTSCPARIPSATIVWQTVLEKGRRCQ